MVATTGLDGRRAARGLRQSGAAASAALDGGPAEPQKIDTFAPQMYAAADAQAKHAGDAPASERESPTSRRRRSLGAHPEPRPQARTHAVWTNVTGQSRPRPLNAVWHANVGVCVASIHGHKLGYARCHLRTSGAGTQHAPGAYAWQSARAGIDATSPGRR